jgi:hypothetical protein
MTGGTYGRISPNIAAKYPQSFAGVSEEAGRDKGAGDAGMFSYRLSTRAFAAAELARWALKPIPVARSKPKPPRLICRAEGGRQVSYQLTVHRNGKKAHVDGPDISADFGGQQLTRFMTGVVTKWSDSYRSLVPPGIDSEPHSGGH